MARHKWKHIEGKIYVCKQCGIHKRWEYGDYQCWYYYEPAYGYGAVEKGNFKRPECKGLKISSNPVVIKSVCDHHNEAKFCDSEGVNRYVKCGEKVEQTVL